MGKKIAGSNKDRGMYVGIYLKPGVHSDRGADINVFTAGLTNRFFFNEMFSANI